MIHIPQASPSLRIARWRSEIDAAVKAAIGGDRYILGAAVAAFEAAFAQYLGVAHCVGVGSGTDAIALALRGLGIGPGDEVITTALTAAGTAQAILQCGAQPRFVDIDPRTRCLDPQAAEEAVTSRSAAILVVHLFGEPADMPRLSVIAKRHKLALIEDCAHAHGATIGGRKVGTFGDAGAFSFYPTKNLGAVGDAGAVVCAQPALAERLRRLRSYGLDEHGVCQSAAGNSRLDEIQAALLLVLLRHLDDGNDERRQLAADYRRLLAPTGVGLPPQAPGAVYHQFAITHASRDTLRRTLLEQEGVVTSVHYYPPLHRHPAFADAAPAELLHTDSLAANLLSLPIQPEVAGPHLGHIVTAVERSLARCRAS